MTRVLVLGGGPDAERSVSLASASAVASALAHHFDVTHQTIDRLSTSELASLPGDVVFPVLHGQYGEGGPLQDLLEADGRPYVGSGPRAARACMDKMGCKLAAASLGIRTAPAFVFDPRDDHSPLDVPLVLKPTHDGSSVGLHICRNQHQWPPARDAARADINANPARSYLIEQYIAGTEITAPLLAQHDTLAPLPLIEIRPAQGVYDYEAKYARTDTQYVVDPPLTPRTRDMIQAAALNIAAALGVRDLARADFLIDPSGQPWFLEINTMPGFTATSLVPKSARASGLDFAGLCAHLVRAALSRARTHA